MDPESKNGRPATRGRRFLRLAGMTASVAGRYASDRIRALFRTDAQKKAARSATHQQIGERISRTLGELKGAAMKIGQMASISSDILPEEISRALAALQKEAPPVGSEVIRGMIEAELGTVPERLFRRFDPAPYAAASIGQVHRATTDDGREVVVKVQYPGVDESVDSDLAHLKMALKAGGFFKGNKGAFNRLFEEVRDRLHEELDYCNEADNLRLFRSHHRGHEFVHLPDVVGERSSKRVLTLTYEGGDELGALERSGYSQQLRDRIGKNLFALGLSQVFDLQVIHADPNPANFAFKPDGSIVLYDFGCVKRLKPEVVEVIKRTIRAAVVEDYGALEAALLDLGARNPRKPSPGADFYKTWRDILVGPLLAAEPFDYGSADIHREVIKRMPILFKYQVYFQPPVEIVYLNRMSVGHYGNLRRIGARVPALDLVAPYVGL